MRRQAGCAESVSARRPRRPRSGMTLVELLIGVAILLVSSLSLLAAYRYALELSEVAHQSAVAVNDIKDMLERIKTTSVANLQTDFPNGVANAAAYTTIVGGLTLSGEQITTTHSPSITADPRELSVQVTWTNRGRTYQRSLSTLRSSQAS